MADARLGVHIPLPGGVPDDLDADLDEPKRGADQSDRASSPKKHKSDDMVTMSSLRSVLAETSMQLLQAQQQQMSSALAAFEERQSSRLDRVETKLSDQGGAVEDVQHQLRELQDRVAKVEGRAAPAVGPGPDRKSTLVFGGWASDTRKAILLPQLDHALRELQLKSSLDSDPLTTGARRSVALCQFRRRAGEADGETKQRMLRVVQTINAAKVHIEGAPRPLWASFSKSPEERGRGALTAVVKKSVMQLAPHRQSDLDLEYSSGRSWIKEDQLSGMGSPPEEVKGAKVVHTKGGEGWIDEKTLSRWLDVSLEDLRRVTDQHRF